MIACSVDDLPAPFGPISPTISPGRDLEREAAHGVDAAVADVERLDDEQRAHLSSRAPALSPRYAAATSRFARISRRRALGERRALVEHVDAVADLHDQRHVVVDQQHAGAVLVAHRADDRGELGHLRLREAGGRLVHQDEARLGRERARDAEPPLVAVRERRRRARPRTRRARARSSSSAARAPRAAAARADAERRDLDVLAHRQRAERVAVLERAREPVPAAAVRRPARDVAALELDRAARRPVEAAEHVDERRLAGAVRADQADDLAAPQLERDAAERLHALERA